MITAITLLTILSLFAALIGLAIRQKAIAHQQYYRDQFTLNEPAPLGSFRSKRQLKAASTRLRNTALARRRIDHACVAGNRVFTHV